MSSNPNQKPSSPVWKEAYLRVSALLKDKPLSELFLLLEDNLGKDSQLPDKPQR